MVDPDLVLVFVDIYFSSDTHILIPFQAATISIIILHKGHIQPHTFDIPEFRSMGKECHA